MFIYWYKFQSVILNLFIKPYKDEEEKEKEKEKEKGGNINGV